MQVVLPPDIKDKLFKYADMHYLSASQVIAIAIAEKLKRDKKNGA